jgi:PEP-CTERM motif
MIINILKNIKGGMTVKKVIITVMAIGVLMAACIGSAQASLISWTDWTGTDSSGVFGTLNVDGNTIGVTFSGLYFFAPNSGVTNFWEPSAPYISATVDNAPPAIDIIGLNDGGSKTITFSQMVQDPLLALVSWNDNTVDFGVPIEIVSYGQGFFGNGTPILNAGGTGFYSDSGEVHGVIRLPGAYDSITFTDTTENWHGFTVGVTGLPTSTVPEPSSLLLLGAGLLPMLKRRKR